MDLNIKMLLSLGDHRSLRQILLLAASQFFPASPLSAILYDTIFDVLRKGFFTFIAGYIY